MSIRSFLFYALVVVCSSMGLLKESNAANAKKESVKPY